jgi:hypothetical protein
VRGWPVVCGVHGPCHLLAGRHQGQAEGAGRPRLAASQVSAGSPGLPGVGGLL